jgi:NRAMP (natural resistance-associated macrophage protein)-like metal ion transporter
MDQRFSADSMAQLPKTLPARLKGVTLLNQLGPGLITGAADDDPSGIATYSQAGAQFGFNLLWTLLLTFPLMVAIQMVSALIGRVTGHGLAKNMGDVLPGWLATGLMALLFLANTINVGADLAAMGEAAKLVIGFGEHEFTIAFAVISLGLQLFIPYRRYARFLTVLTFSLFAYVALLFMLKLDWPSIGAGLIGLHPNLTDSAATTIVAIFGTTISPYLFFWQSAQEVEEVDQKPDEHPLVDQPEEAPAAIARIEVDTISGMLASNLIALAIMISTAATLHQHGITNINTAGDAAKALEPIAGRFAFGLFSIGIIGTGLLAIPVLAGSSGYAIAESRGWKTGLDNMPWQARGFYAVIGAAVLLGLGIDYSPIDPIKALYWSAVLNGVIAVPMMAAMMVVAGNKRKMGRFTVGPVLGGLGWLSAAVMAAATITMIYVSLR